MYYYKEIDLNGNVISVISYSVRPYFTPEEAERFIEITAEEYEEIKRQMEDDTEPNGEG